MAVLADKEGRCERWVGGPGIVLGELKAMGEEHELMSINEAAMLVTRHVKLKSDDSYGDWSSQC